MRNHLYIVKWPDETYGLAFASSLDEALYILDEAGDSYDSLPYWIVDDPVWLEGSVQKQTHSDGEYNTYKFVCGEVLDHIMDEISSGKRQANGNTSESEDEDEGWLEDEVVPKIVH